MQGTVATYDPDTHAGTLLLDDGTELAFPPEAFERVTVESGSDGGVSRVALPGID